MSDDTKIEQLEHAVSQILHGEAGDSLVTEGSKADKRLEALGIVILALATVLTAWSGFQATKWSGVQSTDYTSAGANRITANSLFTLGVIGMIDTQSSFNFWLNATSTGDEELAAIYEARLQEDIPEAWEAWLALDPLNNPDAPKSPLEMEQFEFPTLDEFQGATEQAETLFQEGQDANATADNYVLATVFFAVALFFSGMSTSLNYRPVRVSLLIVAAISLIGAGAWIATLPIELG